MPTTSQTVFIVGPQDSWFANRTKHHIRLPRDCVDVLRAWKRSGGSSPGSSVQLNIFAGESSAGSGALNFRSGHLTGVTDLFSQLAIREHDSERPTLLARLHLHGPEPQIFFRRLGQDELREDELREDETPTQHPLLPFSEKSEEGYLVDLKASVQERKKAHEKLLNAFARFLRMLGHAPAYSKTVDLALQNPPLIVEAKAIRDQNWTECVRGAVAQLHEYRYFNESLRHANLLFLASEPVPGHWTGYLKIYHQIRSAWPVQGGFHVEDLDEILPVFSHRKKPCVFVFPPPPGTEPETTK